MSQNDADGENDRTALDHYSRGIPRLGQSRSDPVVAAVTQKLVRGRGRGGFNNGRRALNTDNASIMARISDETSSAIINARNAMQLLPDLEIAINLLISAILSPQDLNTIELTYGQRRKILPAATSQLLLDKLKEHFEEYHNLRQQLKPALYDILAETGSYPVLIMAENSLDRMINTDRAITMESLGTAETTFDKATGRFQSLGFLGMPPDVDKRNDKFDEFGLESLISGGTGAAAYDPRGKYLTVGVQITDNPSVLRLQRIRDRLRADRTAKLMSSAKIRPSFETHNESGQLIHTAYRDPNYRMERQLAVPTTGAAQRSTVGHPLVMKLPSESVIPAHEPGNPNKHLGYFILLEDTGSPVHKAFESDYYRQMVQGYGNVVGTNSFATTVLRDAKLVALGSGTAINEATMTFRQLSETYSDLLEYELNSRLQRGVYGAGAKVARPEDVYRIMFARAMAGRGTQLLYVPEEMLVYMAFSHNQYGIGESLIQKSIILAGQRASLSVASVMTELKNAIARSTLDITLDEDDDDPLGTVEHAVTENAKLRNSAYPMAVFAPSDIIDYLQNAAIDVNVTGNTGYPNTKVNINEYNSNRPVPNLEFQKDLRNRMLWAFGVPPELVDVTQSPEFATSIVTNNLMLSKTVIERQDQLCPFLAKYVRTYVISDGMLMEELREILRDAKRKPEGEDIQTTQVEAADQIGGSTGDDTDRILLDFLAQLTISLPRPEGAKKDNMKAAFDKYGEFLDAALPAYLSTDTLTGELAGQLGVAADTIQKAYKALFMRRWIRANGAAPELEEMLELGESGSAGLDLLAELEAHSSPLLVNLRDYLIKAKRRAAADDAVLDTVADQTGQSATASGMGGDTGGGYDNGGGAGDGGFDDQMPDAGAGDDTIDAGDDAGGDMTEETSESSSTETSTDENGTVTRTESSSSSSSSSAQ